MGGEWGKEWLFVRLLPHFYNPGAIPTFAPSLPSPWIQQTLTAYRCVPGIELEATNTVRNETHLRGAWVALVG